MKKVALILSFTFICLCLFACGEKANVFDCSLEEVKSRAEGLDFGGAEFSLNTDEYAEDVLMFQYGIDDEGLVGKIDSYLISTPGTNSAKTLAVFVFKNGVTGEDFDALEGIIRDVYIKAAINRTAMYDATQCEIAEKASFIRYDNALVVIAYDNSGNTEAINTLFN